MKWSSWILFFWIAFCAIGSSLMASAAERKVPMVFVSAGEFMMGDDNSRKDEKPQRKVYLDGFYMDKYPVTNRDFRLQGMKPKKDFGPKFNGDSQPVVGVDWNQANEFCAKVGKRLPTEAEWEKTARGTDGRQYPWGNKWDTQKLISGYTSKEKTHPVDRTYHTHESPYGAVDMAGNVLEWVTDWYGEDYYLKAPKRNPKGPPSGTYRVFRGGTYKLSFDGFFRTSARARSEPKAFYQFVGFRCAKDAN